MSQLRLDFTDQAEDCGDRSQCLLELGRVVAAGRDELELADLELGL
jgi:hypothetical protein